MNRRKSAQAPKLTAGLNPYYQTGKGAAYLGDSLELLESLGDETVDLVVTSPPFALVKQKHYQMSPDFLNAKDYIKWFLPIAQQIHRVLKKDGSFVLHIGGSWNPGFPTKSLYNFKLLLKLCESKLFSLAQDFYWFNPAKMPSPIEWANVERIRVKDAVEPIWWLCKDANGKTKSKNTRVLIEYTESMMKLFERGKYDAGRRPSGYDVSPRSFLHRNKGAIPPNLLPYPNLLPFANTGSNGPYLSNCKRYGIPVNPARFPVNLPEFFIRFLTTRKSQVVLDPFAGSNSTGYAAERLDRRWLAFEWSEDYLKGSMFRFFEPEKVPLMWPREHLVAAPQKS